MLVRANSLCRGYSGISTDLVNKILEILNSGAYPFVPEYCSVGASGDLAPLAHGENAFDVPFNASITGMNESAARDRFILARMDSTRSRNL